MFVQSTRSDYKADDLHAVLEGLAPDGGLFVDPAPEGRAFDWQGCLALPPLGMAGKILGHLLPGFEDMDALFDQYFEAELRSAALRYRPVCSLFVAFMTISSRSGSAMVSS